MILSAQEFEDMPKKAITLIGMSGAGKSYYSQILEDQGWYNYSCDYLIGSKYLKECIDSDGSFKPEDIGSLSDFVGQIGSPDFGGLALAEFQKRQKLYYKAECQVLQDALVVKEENASNHFVNDSSGSLCEIEDNNIIEALGRDTLFVYLEIPEEDHKTLLERAVEYPKPLFFPADFFTQKLAEYISEAALSDAAQIYPQDFLKWVFPHLFAARIPKYERLAERFGIKVNVQELQGIKTEKDFLTVIQTALV